MTTKARKQKSAAKPSSPARRPRYTVFISHSSKDIWIAEQMAEKIEKAGADYRLDKRDFEGGKNIRSEISKGVRESHEVVVLLSPNSKAAKWVIFEAGAAQGKKALIPILYSVEQDDKDLDIFAGMITIDLNKDFNQKYLADLKTRIEKWKAGKSKKKGK